MAGCSKPAPANQQREAPLHVPALEQEEPMVEVEQEDRGYDKNHGYPTWLQESASLLKKCCIFAEERKGSM
jgi:hypothetical protein